MSISTEQRCAGSIRHRYRIVTAMAFIVPGMIAGMQEFSLTCGRLVRLLADTETSSQKINGCQSSTPQTDCRSSSNCNQLQWSRRDLQRARTRKRIKLPIVLHYSLSTLAEQTTYGFIQVMIFQRTVAFSGD